MLSEKIPHSILIYLTALVLTSCGRPRRLEVVSPTRIVQTEPNYINITEPTFPSVTTDLKIANPTSSNSQVDAIIETALSYTGTRYRMGGTTRQGMDCSGLIYTTFLNHDITLQRSSYLMAREGDDIKLDQVSVGDLLFFVTNRGKRINHVGLVVQAGKEIKFIHSSTSRGVIISSLKEGYWSNAFVKAKRIL